MSQVSDETLSKLAQYDTPTICNTIELFDVRSPDRGFMDGRIRAMFPDLPPMVGFASTATFRSSGPAAAGVSLGQQVATFAELPGPPVVVIQDLDDPPVGVAFGEVVCSCYQACGAKGVISNGGARDLDQVRRLRMPAFAGSIVSAHAFWNLVSLGVPVRVGGLVVRPGDLLHGDANGVANIPLEIADELADAAAEFMVAERLLIDCAQGPAPTVADLCEAERAFLAAKEQLHRRLSRRAVNARIGHGL